MTDATIVMPVPSTVMVARWILGQVERFGEVDHDAAVGQIRTLFGAQFTRTSGDRAIAVRASVIAQVRRISGEKVDYDARRRRFCTSARIANAAVDAAREVLHLQIREASRDRLTALYETKICAVNAKIAAFTVQLNSGTTPSGRGGVERKLRASQTDLDILQKKLDVAAANKLWVGRLEQ